MSKMEICLAILCGAIAWLCVVTPIAMVYRSCSVTDFHTMSGRQD